MARVVNNEAVGTAARAGTNSTQRSERWAGFVAVHGNRFIAHLAFSQLDLAQLDNPDLAIVETLPEQAPWCQVRFTKLRARSTPFFLLPISRVSSRVRPSVRRSMLTRPQPSLPRLRQWEAPHSSYRTRNAMRVLHGPSRHEIRARPQASISAKRPQPLRSRSTATTRGRGERACGLTAYRHECSTQS